MSVLPRFLTRADGERADGVSLVPMRRRHLRAAMPIEGAAYPRSWSRTVFEGELDQVRTGTRYYVAALVGRTLVGYAGLWFVADPDGDQAHITNIVVADSHRRSGIATDLMVDLATTAIGRGCVAWTLEVRTSSEGAQALYHRFGFESVGIRQRYYDNTEDAVVMWCRGIDSPAYAARLEELACR